jgi:predicted AlkP superfamily pyrophosphatase or phosphodiesterase
MTNHIFPLTCPVRAKHAGLSLIVQKIMTLRLKCSFLYSSHTLTPCSQSFCMSSINGCKKTSMSMLACLGPDMRVINKRYFFLWHNHGERLYIITGQVLCVFLISLEGFIPSVLRPNLIFLGSLEKSSSWLRSKCFHCLPSVGCRISPSLFYWTCQSKS